MPLDHPRNPVWELDTDRIAPEVAAELLRQGELRQAAIFQAALGMDQRAAVMAAGFLAAAGALAAAGVALGEGNPALRTAAFAGAMSIAMAAGLCAWACRPQKFRFPGIDPRTWAKDPAYLREPLVALQISRAAQLQDHIAQNEARQAQNGRALFAGFCLAALAPALGVFAWLVARLAL